GLEGGGCGRRLHQGHDMREREIRDLPWSVYRATVVVEVHRLRCPECGVRVEKIEQLPSNAPFSKRFEEIVGEACESAAASQVARRFHLAETTVRAIDLRRSPMTFVSKMTFACSAVKASVTPADMIPALLTSTSILPASASTCLTPASTDASSLTSNSRVLMPRFRRASAASRFLPCARRIEAYTVWPARNRVAAVSRPKPLLAPVIRIVLDILGLLEVIRHSVPEHQLGKALSNERDGSHSTSSMPLKVGMRRSLSPSASPSCWWS